MNRFFNFFIASTSIIHNASSFTTQRSARFSISGLNTQRYTATIPTLLLLSRRHSKTSKNKTRNTCNDEDEDEEWQIKRNLNRRQRMEHILRRDGYDCVWCRCAITIESATTDHIIPRIKGGPSWIENEVACCKQCNKARGHLKPLDWLEICEDKGYQPNQEVIVRCLQDLDRAIQQRGGQRKARPHLAAQLRRITNNNNNNS